MKLFSASAFCMTLEVFRCPLFVYEFGTSCSERQLYSTLSTNALVLSDVSTVNQHLKPAAYLATLRKEYACAYSGKCSRLVPGECCVLAGMIAKLFYR